MIIDKDRDCVREKLHRERINPIKALVEGDMTACVPHYKSDRAF